MRARAGTAGRCGRGGRADEAGRIVDAAVRDEVAAVFLVPQVPVLLSRLLFECQHEWARLFASETHLCLTPAVGLSVVTAVVPLDAGDKPSAASGAHRATEQAVWYSRWMISAILART